MRHTCLLGRLAHGLVAALLPRVDREAIVGDVVEEGNPSGSLRSIAAVSGIALHVHSEPYRDEGARLGTLLFLVLGLGLIWAVRTAGWGQEPPLDLYSDPLSRMAIKLWSAPHLTSAVAAGLLVGHAPWFPGQADPARWHVAFLLGCLACWTAPAWGAGIATGALLLAATWVGDSAREGVQMPGRSWESRRAFGPDLRH